MKIAMLISGGVDSSVALRLLKDEGHDITAFYLKIWLEDEFSHLGDCPWEEDLNYVRQVCKEANVPLEIVNMQKEYWDQVVSYTIKECKAGRTPNPDIFCNQLIKFGAFFNAIDDSFEKVATGHYAQIKIRNSKFEIRKKLKIQSSKLKTPNFILKKAPDSIKDQTYFLAHLDQKQLFRAMFPIGKYTKKEVRELAEKYNLPNKNRRDSQGICFLGKIPYREFIKEHLGEMKGDFINKESGEKIGNHKGHWFYTIGQRFGLGLSGGPWFVVDKNVEKNIIYLANGYEPEEVYKKSFLVLDLHWINSDNQIQNSKFKIQKLSVKIRHGKAIHSCKLTIDGKTGHVTLDEPIYGVAPGQFAVFYDGNVCLGCGKIQ